jgi:hypothetical protein
MFGKRLTRYFPIACLRVVVAGDADEGASISPELTVC